MITDLQNILSTNIKGMKRSAIRELLKYLGQPGLISFSGGFPSPLTFPIEELKTIIAEVMENEAAYALQYGTTEGDNLLRTMLANRYKANGIDVTQDNIIITTASQQALDLISKMFINPGDYVVVVNADKIKLTGNKWEGKIYDRYSGWMGGYSVTTAKEMLIKHPTHLVEHAVKGMLRRNKLNKEVIKKLKVYAGPEHPHIAQVETSKKVLANPVRAMRKATVSKAEALAAKATKKTTATKVKKTASATATKNKSKKS